ncbi:MAG TPA: hypothetical protein VLC72_00975, partial [Nitrosopumilaceae archaeon]|nr:hypothetical protein [Nitrosopumilaceae archaeon]
EALQIIGKLKQAEIGNSERLESIKEKLEQRIALPIPDIRYFNEKAKELKRLQAEKELSQESKPKMKSRVNGNTDSPFTLTLKISDVMLACACIVYVIWILGLFLFDISPIHEHLLGLSLGLGVGVVIIYKIQKKANQSFNQ